MGEKNNHGRNTTIYESITPDSNKIFIDKSSNIINQQENLSTEDDSQDQSKVDTNPAEFLKNKYTIEKDNENLK